MKSFVICAIFVVSLNLNSALPTNSSTELDYDNYIDSDDYDYVEVPLGRGLDDDDFNEKDEARQVIFNPRKRRERRRRHRGKC